MSELKSLVLAVLLSVLVLLAWRFTYDRYFAESARVVSHDSVSSSGTLTKEGQDQSVAGHVFYKTHSDSIRSSSAGRVLIENHKVRATVNLHGLVLDDLILKDYRVSATGKSDNVVLLSPKDTKEFYAISWGWVDPEKKVKVPGPNSRWNAVSVSKSHAAEVAPRDLESSQVGEFEWDNGKGLKFYVRLELDDAYMFKISQTVINATSSPSYLLEYGQISRYRPDKQSYWISHEGAYGAFGKFFEEWRYGDIEDSSGFKASSVSKNVDESKSWFGITDKYWFTAMIPGLEVSGAQDGFDVSITSEKRSDGNNLYSARYNSSYLLEVPPKGSVVNVSYLFAGAKEIRLLDEYKKSLNISMFDQTVDFGKLYFITKPVFLLLDYFYSYFGNFGLAIIMLTVIVKFLMLPLSASSYMSMMRLKSLSPKISNIKQLYKNDNVKASREISALFKQNNIHPLSSFWPILFQIPVFFALYKVLFVTIEMRHAKFYLWIKDLSSPDSANILNMFGLLDYHPPFVIGVLPVLLGITMIIQQHINERIGGNAPDSVTSTGLLKALPYLFMFIFSGFPSGLVLYWITGNLISIVQQFALRFFFTGSKKGKTVSGVDGASSATGAGDIKNDNFA